MIIQSYVPPPQPENNFVAIDSEWFGLDSNLIHRPTSGKFGCMTIATNPETVYVIRDPENISTALFGIRKCIWVIQNSKFDVTQLRRHAEIEPRKKLWDTMLIDRILWGGYYDRFGLEHLARRNLNIELDKSLQKSFENATELSDEQIEYAALDTSVTLQVCEEQKKYLTKTDMKIWKEIDLPALWAIMDFQGFRVDADKWRTLAETNKKRQDEIDDQLGFNPRSYKQAKIELRNAGFKGLPSTGEAELKKYIKKYPDTEARQLAERVLESRKYGTRASRYGIAFLEKYIEEENDYHVVYGSYDVNGAETGRTACHDPNMQNIPSRDTKEYRECFIPRPDNVLLIADYSAQEPRISAFLSKDRKLKKIFDEDRDLYNTVALEIFNEKIQKGDKRRDDMKSLILGLDYGMSVYGLANEIGVTADEAEQLVNSFFRAFPQFALWHDQQKKKKKLVKTIAGRKIWLNPYSDQCERNALNGPHQGGAADMLKKSLGTIHQEWNFDYPFAAVGEFHDEIVFDVPEKLADEVAPFIKKIMEQTGNEMCNNEVPFKVDVVRGRSWADK